MTPSTLLNPSDPHPVRQTAEKARKSPFLLLGDHAGSAIPAALGDLGLGATDRARHIAVDIGVEAMGAALAERMGAGFVSQAYSRLVVDCNRSPEDESWIAAESDGSVVPGNIGLALAEREARRGAIFEPYHQGLDEVLEQRRTDGRQSILVSLHSFTPEMAGETRPWHIGVLHDGHRDDFARGLLAALQRTGLTIGDNEPYRMDTTDYTVPRHAFARGLRYAEIEVRQDWLASSFEAATAILQEALETALANLD